MISKTMRTILHALSYGNIEVEASRRLADIKQLDAMRIFFKKLDTKVYNGNYEVPIRLYFPSEEAMSGDSGGASVSRCCCSFMEADGSQKVLKIMTEYAAEWHSLPGILSCLWSTDWHRNTDSLQHWMTVMKQQKPCTRSSTDTAGRSGQNYDYRRQCGRQPGGSSMPESQRYRRLYSQKTDSDLSGSKQLLYRRIPL